MTLALEIDSLSFHYPDGQPALDAVSLRIEDKQRVAILGPNGAGKSTLLLHLNGLLSLSSSVKVYGQALSRANISDVRSQIGMVFQNPDDQLFCQCVGDDVAFGPRNMGLSAEEIEQRVQSSLAAVQLGGFEHRSPLHLSVGQKKRAALATVLAMDAKLLALDEPTAGLDPRGRRQLIELLLALDRTQVVITHDLNLARQLCPRAILLSNGRVVADEDCQSLLDKEDVLREHGLM